MFNRFRIIPCLLISDGGLVKTIKFNKPIYIGDPINAVRIFNEEEADELCLIDISSHKRGRIDFGLLRDIASEAFMPMTYGGGIRTLDEAKELYRMGFEKLMFNTMLSTDAKMIKDVIKYAGAQSVIASIDVKTSLFGKKNCYVDCGHRKIDQGLENYINGITNLGVGEIFVNSMDRDGTMKGYDIDLIKIVTALTNVPVIACGGAGSLEDMRKVIYEGGAHAASAGSMFVFYGPRRAVLINYPTESELEEAGIV